MKSNYFRSH